MAIMDFLIVFFVPLSYRVRPKESLLKRSGAGPALSDRAIGL